MKALPFTGPALQALFDAEAEQARTHAKLRSCRAKSRHAPQQPGWLTMIVFGATMAICMVLA